MVIKRIETKNDKINDNRVTSKLYELCKVVFSSRAKFFHRILEKRVVCQNNIDLRTKLTDTNVCVCH